ncbi:hypothetical protein [Sphingomonas jatrophae]|uniref:Uncharacterized protein n=1 Tax=Sphingomonas jatrophae TaxID=1166337 RepID=A0A1I6M0L9_9SPHN|nr:hypothetical protein [Sphingomonas jatrophae]SFS09240.1 hypothetical protein SAMN05192580_3240 [Sphingomonas jatrophae]
MRMLGGRLFSAGWLEPFLERRFASAAATWSQPNMRIMTKAAVRQRIQQEADIQPIRLARTGEVSIRPWSLAELRRDEELGTTCATYRASWAGSMELWDAAVDGANLRPVVATVEASELVLTVDVIDDDQDLISALFRSEEAAIRKHLAAQHPLLANYRGRLKMRAGEVAEALFDRRWSVG